MQPYDTMVEALDDLRERGYVYNFNLRRDAVECPELSLQLTPDRFSIAEVYRFEGMSNPDDNSILFAIESDNGVKGVLVNAYGAYADPVSDELMLKLNRARPSA